MATMIHFSLQGVQVLSQANSLYLDLGSLHQKMKIEISRAFRKIKFR
jgi:hypothetical protein